MSKSTRGIRVAGIASLAVSLSIGVAAPALALPGFSFERIGGDDRYMTAALVADEYGNKEDVVLANGQPGFYADALTGNYISGIEDAPILLTRLKGIPQSTLDQLDQMGAKNITVVGGESVVPAAQVAQLQSEGYTVTRVSGTDRFGTNAAAIAKGGAAAGGVGLIATGFNFPDALAAGPFAYQGHPLGLTTQDNLPDSVGDALEADGVKEVLIFGGTDVVGAGVVSDLAARGITVKQRFAGADRSETSELAAEWALANLGFTNKHVGVASGYTEGYGADALAGGPLEGKEKSPMLITRNVDNPDDVIDYLTKHSNTLVDGHLFGGPAAVSAAAEAAMEKAAQGTAAGRTSAPELVSARITKTVPTEQADTTNPAGTTVVYTFDEAVANAGGLAPTAGDFFVYEADGDRIGSATVVSVSGSDVTVRFNSITTAAGAAALSVATVDDGAVRDLDGLNSPEGDAALGSTTGGGTITLPAGVTDAPDLVSVSGFRPTATAGETAVDFTFDENATTTDAGNFQLIELDGNVLTASAQPASTDTTPAGGGTVPGGNGTTTITVIFDDGDADPNTRVMAADIARGVVQPGTVAETADNDADDTAKDENVLQTADVSNSGRTVGLPDLESVSFVQGGTGEKDSAIFTFDEAVTINTPTSFDAYNADAVEIPGTAIETGAANGTSASTQIIVEFADNTALNEAVGAVAKTDAASDVDSNENKDDEVGVANSTSEGSQTAGKTAGPDLTAVALETTKNLAGTITGVKATYTFDEALAGAGAAVGAVNEFHLYMADGSQAITATSCTVGPASATTDDNTVVCNFNLPATDVDKALEAVLGTVDYDAVRDATNVPNPEGAEFTTGGSGTPAA